MCKQGLSLNIYEENEEKAQQNSTAYPAEYCIMTKTVDTKYLEHPKLSITAGGSVNWHDHFGELLYAIY